MKNLCLVMALLALPLSAVAQGILVLGDSISAAYGMPRESGWVALLEQQLDREYPGEFQVVNASVSGETTAGGRFRLPELLAQEEFKLVIIELGGNDGLRGMSLAEMESNLAAMIRLSGQEKAQTLLLSVELPASYGLHFKRKFAEVFARLAKEPEVGHLAMGFDLLKDRNLLQEDGIHPTEEAQPLLLDAVWARLEPLLDASDR